MIDMTKQAIVEKNLYVDYKPMSAVTNATRAENKKRTVIGSIRYGSGQYLTDKEKQRLIRKAWRKRLK